MHLCLGEIYEVGLTTHLRELIDQVCAAKGAQQ